MRVGDDDPRITSVLFGDIASGSEYARVVSFPVGGARSLQVVRLWSMNVHMSGINWASTTALGFHSALSRNPDHADNPPSIVAAFQDPALYLHHSYLSDQGIVVEGASAVSVMSFQVPAYGMKIPSRQVIWIRHDLNATILCKVEFIYSLLELDSIADVEALDRRYGKYRRS